MAPLKMTRLLAACALSLVVAACGASSAAKGLPSQAQSVASSATLQVASSELTVGSNRFTFGVIANNRPVQVNRAQVLFYRLHGTSGILERSSTARFNYFSRGVPTTAANSAAAQIGGVYVTYVSFATSGPHGVEVRIRFGGHTHVLRSQFQVVQHSETPAVGGPAPRSKNPTTAQEPATRLDSGRPPDDMHRVQIASAIAHHRPLLVLFATAAFCESRLCGPEISVVQHLERTFGTRIAFVHIEIYRDAVYSHGRAPTVLQWRLQTEPWVFVVNRRGIIVAKFEGPTTASEIEPALRSVMH